MTDFDQKSDVLPDSDVNVRSEDKSALRIILKYIVVKLLLFEPVQDPTSQKCRYSINRFNRIWKKSIRIIRDGVGCNLYNAASLLIGFVGALFDILY